MARLAAQGADSIYEVAQVFCEQALRTDGSILSPGDAVWTAANLDELHQRFTVEWDGSDASFETKLQKQLQEADDAIIQLMAELLLMHLLVNSRIGGASKRDLLRRVLAWMATPIDIPAPIDSALDSGLAWPGMFFNLGRDRQLRFLIEWMRSWKALDAGERDPFLSDPWAFKEQAFSVDDHGGWLQRSAVLHMLYPDTFERMMLKADKQAAITAFADRVGGLERARGLDEDRALLEIRGALAEEFGPDFDFYNTQAVKDLWLERKVDGAGDQAAEIPLLDRVLLVYPGWTGFSDPRFVSDETTYKRAASDRAKASLSENELRRLIDENKCDEVLIRVEKAAQSTNLLYLAIPQEGDLSLLKRQGLVAEEFAPALLDLLHGDGTSAERLDRFAEFAASRKLPNKWALPTYLLMLLHPDTEFFVKPRATAWLLDELGADFRLGSHPSGEVYQRLLDELAQLAESLADYEPQGMLDIQGYVWTAFRAPEPSKTLVEPFASMFEDWDSAWWAFDVMRDALAKVGVSEAGDPRVAATLAGPAVHLDFGPWLLFGFGTERGVPNTTLLPLYEDQAVFPAAQLSEGFSSDPAVRLATVPASEAREAWDAAQPEVDRVLAKANELFGSHVGSSYSRHNRAPLERAIFDESERTRLFSEGMSVVENASVYDHIAEQGFHFPDWLVTDYVLSLATKPLVILSGISGTGKTKMAQLVAEHVAPDVLLPVPRAIPEPSEASVLHEAKGVLLEHFYVSIGVRQADLFPLPDRGAGLDVELRVPGLSPMPGRLQNIGGASSEGLVLRLYLKGSARDWIRGQFKRGDYIRITPEGPESTVINVEHLPVETDDKPTTSQRIAFLSVRPDWTDNRSLLGYYNPLTEQYQATELLKLMLRAQANPDEPHMVIVDEMNLAKVEYYFSDFLSAVEADSELVLHDAGESLPLGDGTLVPERLRVPQNLFFTGTVNVDETTYMFSPKVLDRANTLEFNDVDLASYGSSETPGAGHFRLRPGVSVEGLLAAYRKPVPQDWRKLPAEYADRLRALHGLMTGYNLHFGYRVANEIARYMNLAAEFVGPDGLETAYDLQVLQKILPKLSGSRAKLETPLTALAEHLAKEDLPLSAAKVERMLSTVKSVGFVSFVE